MVNITINTIVVIDKREKALPIIRHRKPFSIPFKTKDTAGAHLMPIGMQAFLGYNPIRATSDPADQLDFYRKVRYDREKK